jgi:hypothetical protein
LKNLNNVTDSLDMLGAELTNSFLHFYRITFSGLESEESAPFVTSNFKLEKNIMFAVLG